jgi:hypothetical protein
MENKENDNEETSSTGVAAFIPQNEEVQKALEKVLPKLEQKNFFKKDPKLAKLIARCTIQALYEISQEGKTEG